MRLEPIARCARCDTTKAFATVEARDRWAEVHAETEKHTVLTWSESWAAYRGEALA